MRVTTVVVLSLLLCAGVARAEPFGIPYQRVTVDQLNAGMEQAVEASGQFAADLGAPPRVGGFCPSALDFVWTFPSALVEQCVTPSVRETLKKCNVFTEGAFGAGAMAGAADCMSELAGQLDFSKPLDRAASALPTAVACMSKSVIQSSRLSPAEMQAAMGVVDGVKASYDEYQKFAKLAANLATGGPGVIPDFLAVDASGNDGDDSSISVGDWLIEVDKIAQDPSGYAREQTIGKFETSITSAIAGAAMNPTQAIEDLRDWWDPDRPLGGTDEMLRQCRLADAQVVWAGRRAVLEADIASARGSMEHYRKLTVCQITEGAQRFDAMSIAEKAWLIEGVDLSGQRPPVTTSFERWAGYREDYARAVAAYDAFREKEAAFQGDYRERAAALAPLLREADALRELARANVRKCTGTFVAPQTMTSLTGDVVEELKARVLDLKAGLLGFGCSIPMANRFIADIEREIENPYQKWSEFLASARFRLGSGAACSASGAADLQADFDQAVSDSFGSMPAMQSCLATESEKRMVGDVLGFLTALDILDDQIAEAGRQVAACDQSAARATIAEASRQLGQLKCGQAGGVGSRTAILKDFSGQLATCGAEAAASGWLSPPPPVIAAQESSIFGTYHSEWVWNGSFYEARWDNGTVSEFRIESFDGSRLVASRRDVGGPSEGLVGRYEGIVTGNSVAGKCDWTFSGWSNPNHSGEWSASW